MQDALTAQQEPEGAAAWGRLTRFDCCGTGAEIGGGITALLSQQVQIFAMIRRPLSANQPTSLPAMTMKGNANGSSEKIVTSGKSLLAPLCKRGVAPSPENGPKVTPRMPILPQANQPQRTATTKPTMSQLIKGKATSSTILPPLPNIMLQRSSP